MPTGTKLQQTSCCQARESCADQHRHQLLTQNFTD